MRVTPIHVAAAALALALALALASIRATPARAQEPASKFYVARAVGSWVIKDGTQRRLSTLDVLPPSAAIGVDPSVRPDTNYEIVLRDPRTLRTARWRCNPAARCTGLRRASDLTFDAGTLKTSARTGALFINLGETAEERSRVKLVGARGVARDWGIIVLVAGAGQLDLAPLRARVRDTDDLVIRVCVTGEVCRTDQRIGAGDCTLAEASSCAFHAAAQRTTAVRIEVFARADSLIAQLPTARAYAVVTASRERARLAREADLYALDLDALGSSISADERAALEEAAVRRLAHATP